MQKTYVVGELTLGGVISVAVGAGGAGGGGTYPGGSGAAGRVSITWTDTPTCSVWADTNPIAYGANTTLRWTSANADTSFYITNVGYVTPNTTGSATVGPLASTAYNGTAIGPAGTTNCNFTLNVNPPANCTFNGSPVNHGSSVTAYQTATVPFGQSCVSQSCICTDGTLSGSYAYSSCVVGPQCSLSVSPTSVPQGQSSTLTWSSQNATSCTGNNFNTGGATSGNVPVSPSQSTTYTASCTGAGGTAQCTGSGSGGIGTLLSISCTQSWSCVGAGNQTIRQTNADCSTTDLATCVLPQFCSTGQSICLSPTPTASFTASPYLVRSQDSAKITWSTTDTNSCTVTGNGNTWTGTSSLLASCTHQGSACVSNPIVEFTTYTLACDDADADAVQDDFLTRLFIGLVPTIRER